MGWEKKVDKDRNWYSLVEQLEFAAEISEGKAFQDHLPLLETVHVQQTGGGGYSKYRVMMDNTILKVIVSDNVCADTKPCSMFVNGSHSKYIHYQ